MKKFLMILAAVTLSVTTFGVLAATSDASQPSFSGSIDATSRADYRGQEYSTGPDLNLSLKVSDIGLTGLYVRGDFGKVGNTFPLDSAGSAIESDVGIGYTLSLTQDFKIDMSMNHVYNAQEFLTKRDGQLMPSDYNEFRANATYNVLFAQIGQGIGQNKNTYVALGVNIPVTDKIKVGGAVSAYHYQLNGFEGSSTRYNNSEVFASYNLLKNVSVYGKYSFGGKNLSNEVLANYGIVGVQVKI